MYMYINNTYMYTATVKHKRKEDEKAPWLLPDEINIKHFQVGHVLVQADIPIFNFFFFKDTYEL